MLVNCSSSRDDLEKLRVLMDFLGEERPESVVAILPSVRSAGLLRRCQALGLAGYLIEPVIFEDMRRLIRRLGKLEPAKKDLASQRRRYDGRALNVLLVEDSPINQQVVRALLESRGHRVVITGDGESGLEAFKKEPFDLILMDVGLPGRSGPEIAREIRSLESRPSHDKASSKAGPVPILAITADATAEQRSVSAQAGMDATLVKPVRSRSLFEAIDRFLGQTLNGSEPREAEEERRSGLDGEHSIDWSAALEVTGGDKDLLAQIVEAAREELPSLMSAIERSLSEEDLVSVARGAHTIRGSCRYFGARDLARAAEALEKVAHEGSLEEAVESVRALTEPLNRLLADLTTAETPNRPEDG